MNPRPDLAQLGLSTGKKARLHRILYEHGLRNGTALFLPYDQGLEHGPRDFFANPGRGRPEVHPLPRARARVQRQVVTSAGRTLLLVSGGERAGDEAMLNKARQAMEAGATGLIFGRNVCQRGHSEILRFVTQLRDILAKYPSRHIDA